MINDPQVQEFIRQNPEIKSFFEAQMAGLDPASDEAKNKMLDLASQFRRQMEEQGFGRSADQVDVSEGGFRVDDGQADLSDDSTAGGVIEGGETATTFQEEREPETVSISDPGRSFRVDGGRTDIPNANGTGTLDDGATPTGDTVIPPVQEEKEVNRPQRGIDTVWDDVNKDNQKPGVVKDEHYFESKYKHFFDSEKGKEAWNKFKGGLKNAKTVDDLFGAMVFGMLNFPFDMLNAYMNHRKAEAKRMEEEEYMKNLKANHNKALGEHRDSPETFIKKLHDVNNAAVRKANPKLWEDMVKAGIVDEHGNVDKEKLKDFPGLKQTYDTLSASVGRQARDAFVQAYDGVRIPHDHPMWQQHLAEYDRQFQTTQARGGLQSEEKQSSVSRESQEMPSHESTQATPPTPVPVDQEELRRLREENAYLRGQRDGMQKVLEVLGRVGIHIENTNINHPSNDHSDLTQDSPTQEPQQNSSALIKPKVVVKTTYYDEVSAAFPNIQSALNNDEMTQKKVKELIFSEYASENNKGKKGKVLRNVGGAAYSFASVIKDKFKSGEVTFDQAQKLAQYGLDALKARKSKTETAKDGLGFCEQLLKAKNGEELVALYDQYKEALKEKCGIRDVDAPQKSEVSKPQSTQEAPAPQKPEVSKPQPTQEAPAPQKPEVSKPQPTQETPAPQKQTLDQRAQEALTVSQEKGAELSAKEYKNEGARQSQMTKANNKVLDKMLEGLSQSKQKEVLKKLNNQILAQAKEQGLDANTENLKCAIENKCRDLSSRKVEVIKRAAKNQDKQGVVAMVKDKVPAKQAVKMANKGAVKRAIPPVTRQAGDNGRA